MPKNFNLKLNKLNEAVLFSKTYAKIGFFF